MSWLENNVVRDVVSRIGPLHLLAFAAGLAYGAVFALVPVMVLLVLVLGAFGAQSMIDRAIAQASGVLPDDVVQLAEQQLHAAVQATSGRTLGTGVVVSAIIALWGASGSMRRMMEALDVVHRVKERRSFVRRTLVSIGLALGAIFAIIVTIAVIVLGGSVASAVFEVLGIAGAAHAWSIIRWPLLVAITWAAVATAYRYAPASRICGGFATPGTVLATLSWVCFSMGFSWYVGSIATLDTAWGSIASIVMLMLYAQYTALIVLVGALVDVVLWDRGHRNLTLRGVLRRGMAI